MAKICSWCGNKVLFTDLDYRYEVVGNKDYYVCGECLRKISAARKGQIDFEKIKTENTEIELFNHISQGSNTREEMIEKMKIRQEQHEIKEEARQTDPLYDDIHQIACDLRFIKNWLIFCIVAGCVLGFIYLIAAAY